MQCPCNILSSVACPTLRYLSTLSHKRHDFRKNVTKHKMCVLIFSTNLSETFLILRRIQRYTVTNVHISVVMYSTGYYCQNSMKLEFSGGEISPTRCNNCVFILRNGFTLHVLGDNLTHHQEYICCIWPQVSRLT